MDKRKVQSLRGGLLTACLGVGGLLGALGARASAQPYAEVGYGWLTLSSDGYDISACASEFSPCPSAAASPGR